MSDQYGERGGEPTGEDPTFVGPEGEHPRYAAPVAEPSPYGPSPAPVPAPPAPVPAPPAHEARRNGAGFGAVLVAAILGGVIGAAGIGAFLLYVPLPRQGTSPTPIASTTQPSVNASDSEGTDIEMASAKVLPSIVNVAVTSVTSTPFGSQTNSGIGSGIILRSDGYILTNNHVVMDATRIVVRLGTEDVVARLVGTDPSSDLAVIKVDRTGLVAAQLGSSASLRVGQPVVAFGSPFGLDKTVTSGIVSALHRSNLAESGQDIAAYTNLIQTDASINPGNSGGALADMEGRVVGVNTLISSTVGQSAGIGFAIPIDYARGIADQIIAGKKVEHPYMGISAVTIDDALRQQFKLPVSSGALVQQVLPGSPAAKAGVRDGDIIVKIDGQAITSFEELLAVIRSSKIGQTLPVEIVRNDKHVTLDVTLASDTTAK